MKVFQIRDIEGKNTLEQVDIPTPDLEPGEVLIRHVAIGVNFFDYDQLRTAPLKNPVIPGIEAVGIVEKIGHGVSFFKPGQRVGYATAHSGAYSEYRAISQNFLFPVHESITNEAAVLNMTKGMAAHYLLKRTFFLRDGMTMLIHGAGSNLGKLMLMLAKEYKAKVIATVGSNEKKQIVTDLGAAEVFNYNTENFEDLVSEATKGAGVHVVYDLIGGNLLKNSLKCLMPFGLAVSVGNAMEKSHPISPAMLSSRSLFLTAPRLGAYKRERVELMMSVVEVFGMVKAKVFPSFADTIYSWDEIPLAFSDIAAKSPTSKVILLN